MPKNYFLLLIALSSLLYTATISKHTFVPIMVGDIIITIPHTIILQDRDNDGIEDALDTPTANTQNLTINTNSSNYNITLTGQDNDNPITFIVLSQPSHGTVSGTAPNLLYAPNNEYEGEDSFTFMVSDGSHNSSIVTISISVTNPRTYGKVGSHTVSHRDTHDDYNTSIYYPNDIPHGTKVPVVFFDSGYGSEDARDYTSLLSFIASHGYYVIYTKYSFTPVYHAHILESDADLLSKLDSTRIGVVGHSLGAGNTFRILDFFSDKGYGENGRFIMALEAWYAFGMDRKAMKNLPSNTNVVMQQYGIGGNNTGNDTDPRIPLSEFYLLDSIDSRKKDWQIVEDADHGYPFGSNDYSTMQGILKPLDALMEYTFKGRESAHDIALELGSDDPYARGNGIQVVNNSDEYAYKCSDNTDLDIRYCDMRQFVGIDTNESIIKPDYNSSYSEPNFASTVTRITDRSIQTGNAHQYPKTQVWNSDMTWIRLGYRLYDAQSFAELETTKQTLIDGQLNEMKWSSKNPNIFYGMNRQSTDAYRFTKATINNDVISYTYPISFSKDIYDEVLLGKYEGNIDFNDKYVVFSARKKGQKFLSVIVYDIENNTASTAKDMTHIKWDDASSEVFDWISISPLGNTILISWVDEPDNVNSSIRGSIYQYDRSMNFIRKLADHGNHGDMGLDALGKEVYVQYGFGSDRQGNDNRGIWSYPLDGTERIQLLPSKYNGGHLSCRNYNLKGWCYLSTSSQRYREVLGVKLDGSGVVNRFAQTHFESDANHGDGANVSVSPDAQKVLFYSNWGEVDGVWDTYHVE
jgi:hypothetical protein